MKHQLIAPYHAENFELKKLDELKPNKRNSRKHPQKQIDQLCASILEFGFTIPILIDEECTVLAGHARLEAAKKIGLDVVPTITAAGWSEAQKKAYLIADNKLAENSEWDFVILTAQLEELETEDFNFDFLGFSQQLDKEAKDENVSEGLIEKAFNDDFNILITFKEEEECRALFEELKERGMSCKIIA
jgi:ParB-like chromosome segregation protein Spo0J